VAAPQVIGVARGWEVTGNDTLHYIATHFFDVLSTNYTYGATGGSNVGEHWRYPGTLGDALVTDADPHTHEGVDSNGYHTEESCTQYNVLKLVRHLFMWRPEARLADDYEHKCALTTRVPTHTLHLWCVPRVPLTSALVRVACRLTNGVLGIQHPHAVGQMVYMTPLGKGVSRQHANWDEGAPAEAPTDRQQRRTASPHCSG
jgi:hypothetical protein